MLYGQYNILYTIQNPIVHGKVELDRSMVEIVGYIMYMIQLFYYLPWVMPMIVKYIKKRWTCALTFSEYDFRKMEEELKCPVCLDFFTPPVRMTNCGHNYCHQCLTMFTATPWHCPECRTEQAERPEHLARNFFLERSLENFTESRRNICATHNLPKRLRKYFFDVKTVSKTN